MKPVSHQYEDKLLEFAYGELPAHEASAVDAHVKTCARCTSALEQIRSVRSAMSALPQVPVSDKGLDSLLAYAEQAAKRNAEAAAPAPFFGRFRKWIAPLAGATAVLLVGGLYWKASQNVDLTREGAAKELVAEKKSEAERTPAAPTAAPAPAKVAQADVPAAQAEAQGAKPLELAEKNANELEKGKEGDADSFDRLVDTKAPSKLKKAPAKPSPKTVQRDDKERSLKDEELAAAKPAATAAPALDTGGKGGGGRREADAVPGNYYDSRTAPQYGAGTGTSTGGLGSEVAKADGIERKSVSKRAAANKDLANGDDAKPVQDNSEGFRAKAAPATKSGKKASKLEVNDSPGGGEIARAPTGSYASGVTAGADKADKKKAEEKAPVVAAKEPAPEPNVWTPQQYAQAQKQQSSPYGLSSSSAAPQQAAQPPPPPPAQVASNSGPSRPSLQLGRSPKGSSISDESLDVQGELQTPSMKSNTQEIANNRKARQQQLADLMVRARAADNAGDLKLESQLCDELLRNDAEGDLRAEGLYRMCNLLQRVGEEDRAQRYCDELQSQFSSSRWAAIARSQEKNRSAAPPKAAQKKAYPQDQHYESPAPAAEQKSAPADAMHAF